MLTISLEEPALVNVETLLLSHGNFFGGSRYGWLSAPLRKFATGVPGPLSLDYSS